MRAILLLWGLLWLVVGCDGDTTKWRSSAVSTTFSFDWLGQTRLLGNVLFENGEGYACGAAGSLLHTRDQGRTWERRAVPVLTDLNAISFASPQAGFVVGDDGVVLSTRDGGVAWSRVPLQVTSSLRAVVFVGVNDGWIAGDAGVLYRTIDAGLHWSRVIDAHLGGVDLFGLAFSDPHRGIVVGAHGFIATTLDGGTTWDARPSSTTRDLTSVDSDGSQAWAVGYRGVILFSNDFGASWVTEDSQTRRKLKQVHIVKSVSGRAVHALGDAGMLLTRDDRQWHQLAMPTSEDLESIAHSTTTTWIVGNASSSLMARNPSVAWEVRSAAWHPTLFATAVSGPVVLMVGRYGLVGRSTDSGGSWRYVAHLGPTLRAAAINQARAWVAGDQGYVAFSDDAGATWTPVPTPTTASLYAISVTDTDEVWISGDRETVLHGKPGGPLQKTTVNAAPVFDMCFPGGDTGWALQTGALVRTRDRGTNWQPAGPTLVGESIVAIACLPGHAERVWVASDKKKLYTTGDAGKTWSLLTALPRSVNALLFTSETQGWAVGGNGTAMHSADGGASWKSIANSLTAALIGIAGLDQTHAIAVGSEGVVVSLTANDWTDISDDLWNVTFSDEDHVWILGTHGMLLHSQDGGATYVPLIVSETDDFRYIWFSTPTVGWIAASDGTLLYSSDAGLRWKTIGVLKDVSEIAGAAGASGWVVAESGKLVELTLDGKMIEVELEGDLRGVRWSSISFGEREHGFLLTINGRIAETKDAGRSWHWVGGADPAGTKRRRMFHAQFLTGSFGIIVGEAGIVRVTSDGGATWRPLSVGTTGELWRSWSISEQTAWVVGEGGVYSTVDGGATWRFDQLDAPMIKGFAVALAGETSNARGIVVGGDNAVFRSAGVDSPPRASALDVVKEGNEVTLKWQIADEDPAKVVVAAIEYRKWGSGVWNPIVAKEQRAGASISVTWSPSDKPDSIVAGTHLSYRIELKDNHSSWLTAPPLDHVYRRWWERQPSWVQTLVLGAMVMLLYGVSLSLTLLLCPRLMIRAAAVLRLIESSGAPKFIAGPAGILGGLAMGTWAVGLARVRTAWLRGLRDGPCGMSKLPAGLRASYLKSDDVLDHVVRVMLPEAIREFESHSSVRYRARYVPIAVKTGDGETIEEMTSAQARRLVGRKSKLSFCGAGGAGKSTLAFALARWTMSSRKEDQLFERPEIAIVVELDPVDSLREHVLAVIVRILRELEPDPVVRVEMAIALLRSSRVLIVLDSVSEWSRDNQRQARELRQVYVDAAMIETSRRSEPDDALSWYIGGFSASMVVKLVEAYAPQLGDDTATQQQTLALATRVIDLVATTIGLRANPLLVRLFVESVASLDLTVGPAVLRMGDVVFAYLKATYKGAVDGGFDGVLRCARILGWFALEGTYVPHGFRRDHAELRLVAGGGVSERAAAKLVVDGFVDAGLLKLVYRAGAEWLAFELDPIAEHLGALEAVSSLPDIKRAGELRAQVLNQGNRADPPHGFLSALDRAIVEAQPSQPTR